METKARERTSKTSKKTKKESSGKTVRTLLIVLAALLVIFGTLYYFIIFREQRRNAILNSTTFHDGVTVNGIDVSGQTIDEAKAALAATAEKEIAAGVQLVFTCNGKSYTADSSKFTITYNTDEVLNEALSLAREGDYQALSAELRDIKENGRAYTIDYTVEPTGVEAFLHSFADEVTTPATPASFEVRYPEKSSDTDAYDTSNIGIIGDEAKKAGLSAEKQAITDIKDAFFVFTEGDDGYGVDIDAVMETVRTRCESKDFGYIEVTMAPIQSDVTVESLKESLFLRGTASTSFKNKRRNTNRCHNLAKACGMVYGTVLQPGEEFSANGILGDRTLKNGWLPAPAVIAGGADHEDQPGGGVCQIATTTYMAVLYGDFEVTARRPHSTPSGYPDGLDATINTVTGYIDFKWKNNTESPCYVFTWIDNVNYTVNCSIYGQAFPDTFDEIELSSTLVEPIEPGEPEYEVKSSLYYPYWMLKNKAVKGSIYESFKTYKLNGKVVETKSIGNTEYKMHPTRYYVWPGYAGEVLDPQYELKANDDGTLSLANAGTTTTDATTSTGATGTVTQ